MHQGINVELEIRIEDETGGTDILISDGQEIEIHNGKPSDGLQVCGTCTPPPSGAIWRGRCWYRGTWGGHGAADGYYQMENHPLPVSAWGGNTSNVMLLRQPSHFLTNSTPALLALVRRVSSLPMRPCHLSVPIVELLDSECCYEVDDDGFAPARSRPTKLGITPSSSISERHCHWFRHNIDHALSPAFTDGRRGLTEYA